MDRREFGKVVLATGAVTAAAGEVDQVQAQGTTGQGAAAGTSTGSQLAPIEQ